MTTKKEYRKILKYFKFMNIATQIADLSYDSKHQVSAMCVKKDFSNIHSIGYNGNYEGGSNKRDSMESGESGFLHAEENALLKKTISKEEMQNNYILFVTMTPCNMCAKRLIGAGVKEVCINNRYVNCGDSEEIFNSVGVNFYYLKDKIDELVNINNIDTRFRKKEKELKQKYNSETSYIEALNYIFEDFFDINPNPLNRFKKIKDKYDYTFDFNEDFFNILEIIL